MKSLVHGNSLAINLLYKEVFAMKVNCDIIKDLLPLYNDNICSDGSRTAVMEHLQNCKSCMELYKTMQSVSIDPVNIITTNGSPDENLTEETPLKEKEIAKKGIRKIKRYWIASLGILFITMLIGINSAYAYQSRKDKGITSENADKARLAEDIMDILADEDYNSLVPYMDDIFGWTHYRIQSRIEKYSEKYPGISKENWTGDAGSFWQSHKEDAGLSKEAYIEKAREIFKKNIKKLKEETVLKDYQFLRASYDEENKLWDLLFTVQEYYKKHGRTRTREYHFQFSDDGTLMFTSSLSGLAGDLYDKLCIASALYFEGIYGDM